MRRTLTIGLLAASAILFTAACSGGGDEESSTATTTPTATATVPAASAAAAVAASLPTTLAPFDAASVPSIPLIDGIAVDLSLDASLGSIDLPPGNIGSSVTIGAIRQPTFRIGSVRLTPPTIPTIPTIPGGGTIPPGFPTPPPGFTFP